jgi:hypothetical protein
MSYLAHEEEYRVLIRDYTSGLKSPDDFIEAYFALWKHDCDKQWERVNKGCALDPAGTALSDVLDPVLRHVIRIRKFRRMSGRFPALSCAVMSKNLHD